MKGDQNIQIAICLLLVTHVGTKHFQRFHAVALRQAGKLPAEGFKQTFE